jgi:ADP-ribosylglycohydrolase
MSLKNIQSKYGPDGIQDLPEQALYTDDTQMTVSIAEALIKAGDQDLETIMDAVRDEFIKWRHSPENNRAPGNACLAGVSNKVDRCLDWNDEEKALKALGEGWIGEEAVALALYCFLRYPKNYRKAVLRGANTNGDSDSIACIAGSISGAYLGIDAVPDDWIKRIEKSKYLEEIAGNLSAIES